MSSVDSYRRRHTQNPVPYLAGAPMLTLLMTVIDVCGSEDGSSGGSLSGPAPPRPPMPLPPY